MVVGAWTVPAAGASTGTTAGACGDVTVAELSSGSTEAPEVVANASVDVVSVGADTCAHVTHSSVP